MCKCGKDNIEFGIQRVVEDPDPKKRPISPVNGVKHCALFARCKDCGDKVEFISTFIGMNGMAPGKNINNDMGGIFLPFEFESERNEREHRRRKTG